MSLDQRLAEAVRRVADGVVVPEVDLDAVRGQARANRRRTASVAVVAVVAAVVVTGVALVRAPERGDPAPVEPVPSPRVVGSGPVWYDAAGLHHGDVVEETPFNLFSTAEGDGVLALVRGGALYRNPATSDVWFHPWAGEPRVIGNDSAAGPGGDPHGDVAAWFEGDELVVYDTARGQEISRNTPDHSDSTVTLFEAPVVVDFAGYEHVRGGNGFLHVSVDEVVWRSATSAGRLRISRLDVATGRTELEWEEPIPEDAKPIPEDAHHDTRLWSVLDLENGDSALLIDVEGGGRLRLDEDDDGIEPIGRLSADGRFVLSPTTSEDSHGAAVVDVRSGEVWPLPPDDVYAWLSWSYGDVALVLVDRDGEPSQLLACDAVDRTCDPLPHEGPVLLPTS